MYSIGFEKLIKCLINFHSSINDYVVFFHNQDDQHILTLDNVNGFFVGGNSIHVLRLEYEFHIRMSNCDPTTLSRGACFNRYMNNKVRIAKNFKLFDTKLRATLQCSLKLYHSIPFSV